ncbi:MAG: hypothetical protein ACRDYU_07835 [Actinomycetes bacterium]
MASIAGFRGRTKVFKGFWEGVMAFWLAFGVLYVIFRGAINEETRVSALTLGDIGELVLLIALWPLEVLGLDFSISS